MRIAEIYPSVQGEGLLTGTPSVFVRASGCNLRCVYCDTPFASWRPEGDDWAVEQILEQVLSYGEEHVVLTGGEPMLFAELVPLTERLRQAGCHITVETAGTLYLPLCCDLLSLSPKLANSTPARGTSPAWRKRHEQERWQPDVLRRLMADYEYQCKFVVGTPADADEVQEWLHQLPGIDRDRVLLMPEGVEPQQLREVGAWLEPYCAQVGLRFCPRRHIEWFGNVRGT